MGRNAFTIAVSWHIAVLWPDDWIVSGYWFGWCNNVLNFVFKHVHFIETHQKVHTVSLNEPLFCSRHRWTAESLLRFESVFSQVINIELHSLGLVVMVDSKERVLSWKKQNKTKHHMQPSWCWISRETSRETPPKTFFLWLKSHICSEFPSDDFWGLLTIRDEEGQNVITEIMRKTVEQNSLHSDQFVKRNFL